MKLYGGVEAGGTKFVCLLGSGPEDIRAEVRFPTTDPETTLQRTIDFFTENVRGDKSPGYLAAIGVASFGPVDLDAQSPTFVTSPTPPKWAGRTRTWRGGCALRWVCR